MARPAKDYRTILHSKWSYQPVHKAKLRTRRKEGHVEIVRDHKSGDWVKLTYDAQVSG